MSRIVLALLATVLSTTGGLTQETPSPFDTPSVEYLSQFAVAHKKVFVLERYDGQGKLYTRDVDDLSAPVEIIDATRRAINGAQYVLRGLTSCPFAKVIYNRVQTWDCKDAAKDYAGSIYNKRASIVLCKTLVLQSTPGTPDPVSCYARVGDGTQSDRYKVTNDDDSMVFLGFAQIGLSKEGEPLRPDLLSSAVLGKDMGLGDAN